ncbi:SNF2 helicase, putative [Bodo saltans]|uniref:SNF2 helicase, putative n=1 Tax=Bodo saltans TaxID=75058 RepID=A0A0S4IY43_BODSA|nr:SNF2 helicase, putative [Bodo saltans]|eukprot:CUG07318.1 SNF2 helicase, putative [Bodo saltans]
MTSTAVRRGGRGGKRSRLDAADSELAAVENVSKATALNSSADSGGAGVSSSSFQPLYPRPAWSLAPWQAIAISVAAQTYENATHLHSLKTHNTFILRDLSKFHTEQKHYSRKREQEQRAASDKIGKQFFASMKKHWESAGRLHQQLLKVDYEATKRNVDAKKQEDMLRETEELTKKLLQNMIRDRQRVPLSSATANQHRRRTKKEESELTVASTAIPQPPVKRNHEGQLLATPHEKIGEDTATRPFTTAKTDDEQIPEASEQLKRDAAAVLLDANDHDDEEQKEAKEYPQSSNDFGGDDDDDDPSLEKQLHLLNTLDGARPLRDYQRSALRWMLHLYNQGLNGILADEMGLGKTVQTLALLAYFAEYKNDWGPHLIVVPTTVVLNWAAECRRWCPGFKVITYIGNAKERAALRQGWTAEDAFHICITTYNLVINDRTVFRRRPWGLLVLDEAHYIKNFASLKWRALFDLQAQHRLMLTGTPLQSSVMELWSLFHFLLPFATAFQSEDEFRDWYSNPMNDMVDGRSDLNEDVVRRLQALLRPFLLRRLKRDVESQLPSKTEKVILCRLSRRQQSVYDEFIQNAETRRRLQSGGNGGLFGVLLQLRKVCNHPDLFAERPTRAPLMFSLPFGTHRGAVVTVPISVMCTTDSGARRRFYWNRMHLDVLISDVNVPQDAPDEMKGDESRCLDDCISERGPLQAWLEGVVWNSWVPLIGTTESSVVTARTAGNVAACQSSQVVSQELLLNENTFAALLQRDRSSTSAGGSPSSLSNVFLNAGEHLVQGLQVRRQLRAAIFQQQQTALNVRSWACSTLTQNFHLFGKCSFDQEVPSKRLLRVELVAERCAKNFPTLVPTLSERFTHWTTKQLIERVCVFVPAAASCGGLRLDWCGIGLSSSVSFISTADFMKRFSPLTQDLLAPLFLLHLDRLRCRDPHHPFTRQCLVAAGRNVALDARVPPSTYAVARPLRYFSEDGWSLDARRCMGFPDKRLLIHDCGKFQVLEPLLKTLRNGGHRALIFTQFTLMLDLLEKFLASIGISYLRIDGATKPEARQKYVDTFNETDGITCMILSTRSGGIGLNLTGADTVIFYDSDWNPTIDLQAQDRCHRIGQTRPVTIFRLVTHHTVEEKILEKAREKKMLNNVVIRGGQFASIANVGGENAEQQQLVSSASNHEEAADEQSSADALYSSLFSTATSLRSFFHDLDEDADINFDATAISAVDVAKELAEVEDVEDQEALKTIQLEMEQERAANAQDEVVMGDRGAAVADDDDERAMGGADHNHQINVNDPQASGSGGGGEVSTECSQQIQRAKQQILRNFRVSISSGVIGSQDAAATAAVRRMASTYMMSHPQHALRQKAHLAEHFGVAVEAAAVAPSSR